MGLTYMCSNGRCGAAIHTDKEGPEEWHVRRNPALFQRCPQCGSFAVPAVLIEPGKALDEQLFFMFAGCVNAHSCSLFDQYGADCEEGRVMTKCFHVIHQRQDMTREAVDSLKNRLARLESLLSQSPGQRGDGSRSGDH